MITSSILSNSIVNRRHGLAIKSKNQKINETRILYFVHKTNERFDCCCLSAFFWSKDIIKRMVAFTYENWFIAIIINTV